MHSHINAASVARELLAGAEVIYGAYGSQPESTQYVELPDGRVATLRVVFDEDSGIGRWMDSGGKNESHHDDVFGTFVWRGKDSLYGYPAQRPTHLGFDGWARVFTRYGQGGDRLDDSVWWQPPAEVLELPDAREQVEKMAKAIDGYLSGDWEHVGLVVTIEEDGSEVGSASLWGVDHGYPGDDGSHAAEMVAENLIEAGIEKSSTAGVARWARDLLEAVARRISDEDPEDAGNPSDGYHETMRELVEWWTDRVEDAGDWDTYADRIVNAIESDYASYLRAPDRSRPGRAVGISYGDDCAFCCYRPAPYPPGHHHADDCPRKTTPED